MEVFCLLQEDLRNSLAIVHQYNAGAVILWGSANDTNSRERCRSLEQYLNSVLGPTIKELSTGTPNSLSLSSDPETLLWYQCRWVKENGSWSYKTDVHRQWTSTCNLCALYRIKIEGPVLFHCPYIYIVDVYYAWMDVLVCSLSGVSPMHTASRQHHKIQESFGTLCL